METVLFSFVGICTHFGETLLTPPRDAFDQAPGVEGPATRVVLPDASLGCRWNHKHIPAHDAVLYIQKRFIAGTSGAVIPGLDEIDPELCTWRLRGVHLYVTGAATDRIDTNPSYRGLPSLARIAGTNVELDPRVVDQGRAAAVIDLYGGLRDAYRDPCDSEARYGKFTVETTSQRLAIVRMRDHATGFIQLQNAQEGEVIIPPWVVLMNTGATADTADDFLLHYYTTTWTPPPTWIPPAPSETDGVREANEAERKLHSNLPQGLTFGCSNSLYP